MRIFVVCAPLGMACDNYVMLCINHCPFCIFVLLNFSLIKIFRSSIIINIKSITPPVSGDLDQLRQLILGSDIYFFDQTVASRDAEM